ENKEQYDVLCSFQVLEHIPEVDSFLRAKIEALKPGGTLLICVPNNDSFISKDSLNVLNMPPHHMGLWNESSLKYLAKKYDLELLDMRLEPMEERHYEWYFNVQLREKFGFWLGLILQKLLTITGLNKLAFPKIRAKAKEIKGHSVFVAFKKKAS
ncbi:MAG: class I SAM-dependent methyltransferase, partial [Luteibaculum sp.]